MRLTVDGATVNVATGAVRIDDSRDEAQPLVVLVHGAGMNRTVWSQQTRFLAHHGYRAVAVDLPGHGGSDGPALDTVEATADWLAGLVGSLGGPAHLIGHSMGSLIALETAARHPDVVSSLVLMGVGQTVPVHPELIAAAVANELKAAELITAWAYGSRQHVGLNPTPGLWMLGSGMALLEACSPDVLGIDLTACNDYPGTDQAAAKVSCPVTIVAGTGDKMTPARSATPIDEVLSDSALVTLDGTGHMMMQEEPEAVRRILIDHLATTPSGRSGGAERGQGTAGGRKSGGNGGEGPV